MDEVHEFPGHSRLKLSFDEAREHVQAIDLALAELTRPIVDAAQATQQKPRRGPDDALSIGSDVRRIRDQWVRGELGLRLGVWNEQEVFGTVRLAGKRGLMIDVMRLYVEKQLEPLLVRAGLLEEHCREAQSLGNQAGYQIHLRIGRIVEESEISELCSVIWFIATRRLNLMIWHEERGFRIVLLGGCFIHRALRLVDLLLEIYDLNVYHTRKINGREN